MSVLCSGYVDPLYRLRTGRAAPDLHPGCRPSLRCLDFPPASARPWRRTGRSAGDAFRKAGRAVSGHFGIPACGRRDAVPTLRPDAGPPPVRDPAWLHALAYAQPYRAFKPPPPCPGWIGRLSCAPACAALSAADAKVLSDAGPGRMVRTLAADEGGQPPTHARARKHRHSFQHAQRRLPQSAPRTSISALEQAPSQCSVIAPDFAIRPGFAAKQHECAACLPRCAGSGKGVLGPPPRLGAGCRPVQAGDARSARRELEGLRTVL